MKKYFDFALLVLFAFVFPFVSVQGKADPMRGIKLARSWSTSSPIEESPRLPQIAVENLKLLDQEDLMELAKQYGADKDSKIAVSSWRMLSLKLELILKGIRSEPANLDAVAQALRISSNSEAILRLVMGIQPGLNEWKLRESEIAEAYALSVKKPGPSELIANSTTAFGIYYLINHQMRIVFTSAIAAALDSKKIELQIAAINAVKQVVELGPQIFKILEFAGIWQYRIEEILRDQEALETPQIKSALQGLNRSYSLKLNELKSKGNSFKVKATPAYRCEAVFSTAPRAF